MLLFLGNPERCGTHKWYTATKDCFGRFFKSLNKLKIGLLSPEKQDEMLDFGLKQEIENIIINSIKWEHNQCMNWTNNDEKVLLHPCHLCVLGSENILRENKNKIKSISFSLD